jgi:hypothetical protein
VIEEDAKPVVGSFYSLLEHVVGHDQSFNMLSVIIPTRNRADLL